MKRMTTRIVPRPVLGSVGITHRYDAYISILSISQYDKYLYNR